MKITKRGKVGLVFFIINITLLKVLSSINLSYGYVSLTFAILILLILTLIPYVALIVYDNQKSHNKKKNK